MDALTKYAVFGGRARRAEYWTFSLVNALVMLLLVAAGRAAHFGYLYDLYALATLLPSVAVGVRRLHDTGRSGWWLLFGAIPVVGSLAMLLFTTTEGEPRDNRYGASPKYVAQHL
ncbi:DUF805 domain-containing protein [Streptomyces mangrovisoli]|uniref:DUF805 domain-containing protein n=1 Tax=Streptomyces mangrovisoli TaxID=1428628 RepID=UPI001F0A35E5|nr:DUF805 domain-containing protein [Streptomyces mangrovisoli]